jgi:hypothetical protein
MHKGLRTDQRSLAPSEEALVRALIAQAGKQDLLPQVSRIRVVSGCTCGCPSIDFALDGRLSARHGIGEIAAEGTGQTLDGATVGVMLWVREGELSGLEIYPIDTLDVNGLPSVASLKVF